MQLLVLVASLCASFGHIAGPECLSASLNAWTRSNFGISLAWGHRLKNLGEVVNETHYDRRRSNLNRSISVILSGVAVGRPLDFNSDSDIWVTNLTSNNFHTHSLSVASTKTNVTARSDIYGPHFIPLVFLPSYQLIAASLLFSIELKEENGPPPARKWRNGVGHRFIRKHCFIF
jgi:hypothetical protein